MTLQTAEVIAFPVGISRKAFARQRNDAREVKREAKAAERAQARPTTAINSDLRKERKDVWRAAEAATRYWRARLEFEDAVSWAQLYDAPEGRSHPDVDTADRKTIVASWRAALVRQLLTAAWDANSVIWKQTTFAKGQYKHTDANPKKIERAIAEDQAWLAAHPTKRTGNREACAKRRAFKEAMRQRVREIAASRDLSDEVIRPVLKLKHEEIGRFCKTYGVNPEWLLEGIEPIFKAWPTS